MVASVKSVARAALAAVLCCGAVHAQPGTVHPPTETFPNKPMLFALPAIPVHELSASLREAALESLPSELVFETNRNWDHQARTPSLQGARLIEVLRKQGTWEKAHVVARDLPHDLQFRLGEVTSVADNRVAFTIHMTMPANVELRKQIWQSGVEVYAAKMRARFQLSADVTVEAVLNEAASGEPAAQSVAAFQIIRATYSCKKFVAENINGVGGDFARLSGGAMVHTFKPWQPVILSEFQKAIASSIEEAGASREARAGMSKLLLQAAAARTTFLQAPPIAVNQLPPAAGVPAVGRAPAQITATPLVVDGIMIEFPLWIHGGRFDFNASRWPEHAGFSEHSWLADHSIQYEHAAHSESASPASSHGDPAGKR
jgi:hypothetical protein